jgi:hypothetical protein
VLIDFIYENDLVAFGRKSWLKERQTRTWAMVSVLEKD